MGTRISFPKPHCEIQRSMIVDPGNHVSFCGRRFGKTTAGVQRIIMHALKDPGLYFWVGLGWKSASLKRAWREIKDFTRTIWLALDENPDKHIRESAKEVELPGKSNQIWMRTAERADSIAGEGIKGAVFDEFTLADEKVWTEYLEATLLDYNGWCLFTGIPKGSNWGSKLWKNCATPPIGWSGEWRGKRQGWTAHYAPTTANPQISAEAVEEIRRHTPQALFRQEYLAEVVDHAGTVFTNIEACFGARVLTEPEEGHIYVFGLDWGKQDDYTVVTVMDASTRELVALARFNEIDYPSQLQNVRAIANVFKPRCIIAESNAMGSPLCDQLLADGLPIQPFYTTNQSKREIIESLIVAFEQKYITIPNDPILVTELEEYESDITSFGSVRYSAPEGGHDDCVISLALAYHEVKHDLGISF